MFFIDLHYTIFSSRTQGLPWPAGKIQEFLIVHFYGHIFLYTDDTKKNKEVFPMKQMKQKSTRGNLTLYVNQPKYPGAADRRYFIEKAINIVTAIVSSMGFITAMLFLLTLS